MKDTMEKCPLRGEIWGRVSALLLFIGGLSPSVQAANDDNNLHFYGALVAEPCVILPGDEEIQLDFGTIIDKYLYLNTRTGGQKVEINLAECDPSLGKSVKVTFKGTENLALPGLLAIDGSSTATGIGIGLETLGARPLPVNKESGEYPLQKGSNQIALKAYVQGEPQAINQKKIGLGYFSVVATVNLEYQ
ncbi:MULTISPECIES: fimbrial protein [Serratia]|uniref:fimbrial protein n=1 Tax=Serratia TaxID=613 RepID=UPI001F4C09FE|nr:MULTISPECIES: fimbrial protein [Serratia]ULG10916.1 exotoxin [Serratia entomophila]CAI1945811.1 Fimbria A protein precursor [Serratia quinivorans]CAI2160005.1 Fimbria A protein precursor [Serratia quinivorans]